VAAVDGSAYGNSMKGSLIKQDKWQLKNHFWNVFADSNKNQRLDADDDIIGVYDDGRDGIIPNGGPKSGYFKVDDKANFTLLSDNNQFLGTGTLDEAYNIFKKIFPGANTSPSSSSKGETFKGSSKIDKITGTSRDDLVTGLGSSDRLTGGKGKDRFIYNAISDSRPGSENRDVITDFTGEEGDRIDLKAIDAYTKTPGNQAFTYIGSAGFTGNKGEVRFSGGVLQMNTGTDKVADMEIALTGVTAFQSSYLIL
jgi:Ca2+-binding RTX toxin-like protein